MTENWLILVGGRLLLIGSNSRQAVKILLIGLSTVERSLLLLPQSMPFRETIHQNQGQRATVRYQFLLISIKALIKSAIQLLETNKLGLRYKIPGMITGHTMFY